MTVPHVSIDLTDWLVGIGVNPETAEHVIIEMKSGEPVRILVRQTASVNMMDLPVPEELRTAHLIESEEE